MNEQTKKHTSWIRWVVVLAVFILVMGVAIYAAITVVRATGWNLILYAIVLPSVLFGGAIGFGFGYLAGRLTKPRR